MTTPPPQTGGHLHFDVISGVAGDMVVGALLDLGIPLSVVEDSLAALPFSGYSISQRPHECGMAFTGNKFVVELESPDDHQHHHQGGSGSSGHEHGHGHRSWSHIRAAIETSSLDTTTAKLAVSIFARIAEAEARIHHKDVEEVEFHEVGALDSIADIVGTAACINYLAPSRITSSPLPLGRGMTVSQHGQIPVPAPATLLILEGSPVVSSGLRSELVTPTGAGIITTLVDDFIELPELIIRAVGHGAGTRKLPDRPNVLRALLGEPLPTDRRGTVAAMESSDVLIEANIDDMSGELCAHAAERLFEAGALDVWWTPITMKKGRPAQQLSALCEAERRDRLVELMFTETTTIGLRCFPTHRIKAFRSAQTVVTPYGEVAIKVARVGGKIVNVAPEYESARRVAEAANAPLKNVFAAANAASQEDFPPHEDGDSS